LNPSEPLKPVLSFRRDGICPSLAETRGFRPWIDPQHLSPVDPARISHLRIAGSPSSKAPFPLFLPWLRFAPSALACISVTRLCNEAVGPRRSCSGLCLFRHTVAESTEPRPSGRGPLLRILNISTTSLHNLVRNAGRTKEVSL
jgi:hypothetical protein